ncbi:GyrI-like domain-containing protein [Methylocella sp.]|uniref:GyrI-like domain-containing protein n=1 Tax=Methylocella sp. TaxID=1978226 RepID=UPI0037832906
MGLKTMTARLARALAAVAALALLAPAAGLAQTPPAGTAQGAGTSDAPLPESDAGKPAPGVSADATIETVEVPSRAVALLVGDAPWADGFKAIQTALDKVKDAVAAASLKQAGPPFTVFLSTDDESFHFEAMIPLAAKPEGKSELSDGVKIGDSPSGKAIKFMHRGAYDDIDSTYDLITAYLDEKGLDSKNLFIEEYLTPTKESDDAGLEADIYVFLK